MGKCRAMRREKTNFLKSASENWLALFLLNLLHDDARTILPLCWILFPAVLRRAVSHRHFPELSRLHAAFCFWLSRFLVRNFRRVARLGRTALRVGFPAYLCPSGIHRVCLQRQFLTRKFLRVLRHQFFGGRFPLAGALG